MNRHPWIGAIPASPPPGSDVPVVHLLLWANLLICFVFLILFPLSYVICYSWLCRVFESSYSSSCLMPGLVFYEKGFFRQLNFDPIWKHIKTPHCPRCVPRDVGENIWAYLTRRGVSHWGGVFFFGFRRGWGHSFITMRGSLAASLWIILFRRSFAVNMHWHIVLDLARYYFPVCMFNTTKVPYLFCLSDSHDRCWQWSIRAVWWCVPVFGARGGDCVIVVRVWLLWGLPYCLKVLSLQWDTTYTLVLIVLERHENGLVKILTAGDCFLWDFYVLCFFASPKHDAWWILLFLFCLLLEISFLCLWTNTSLLHFPCFFPSKFPHIFLFAELIIPCHRYQNLSSFSLISQHLSTPKHHPIFTMTVLTSPIVQYHCITRPSCFPDFNNFGTLVLP